MEKRIKSLFNFFINLSSKQLFLGLFLISAVSYSLSVYKVGSVLWGDSLYYYSYTKSIVLDRDIDFTNEAYLEVYGFPNQPEVSLVTGRVINKFSPGSSILWIPGFVLGLLASHILNIFTQATRIDGYSLITQFITSLTTVSFSVTGLYVVYLLLKDLFSKKVAFLTVLTLFLTTQMFYYTAIDPLNSHSASFMISSLILYMTYRSTKNKLTWKQVIPIGMLSGLLVLVRNQDVVVLVPIFIFLLTRKNTLMDKLNWFVLFWGNVFLVLSIQLFFTLEMYGQFGSPYLIGGETLSWLKPDFIRVLFSFGNGLLVFAPVFALALYGLIASISKGVRDKSTLFSFNIISLTAFLLQLYVVASWGREIIGGPYGSRMFISVLPFLSIGLAYLLNKYNKKKNFYSVFLLTLFLLFINSSIQTVIMLYRF